MRRFQYLASLFRAITQDNSQDLAGLNPATQRAEVLDGITGQMSKFQAPFRDVPPFSAREKNKFALLSQKHMRNDKRERRYAICRRCGHTTMIVGFDRTPSARLGFFSRCLNDDDFTHHKFFPISEGEYLQMRHMPLQQRLNWYRFESDEQNN